METLLFFLVYRVLVRQPYQPIPDRALLGDDEHGWSDNGIANFENGCYAKLINLRKDKEPEIFHAVFHEADYREHGAIIENLHDVSQWEI